MRKIPFCDYFIHAGDLYFKMGENSIQPSKERDSRRSEEEHLLSMSSLTLLSEKHKPLQSALLLNFLSLSPNWLELIFQENIKVRAKSTWFSMSGRQTFCTKTTFRKRKLLMGHISFLPKFKMIILDILSTIRSKTYSCRWNYPFHWVEQGQNETWHWILGTKINQLVNNCGKRESSFYSSIWASCIYPGPLVAHCWCRLTSPLQLDLSG